MADGPVTEGVKVAGGFVQALSSQPVLLVQSAIIAGIVYLLYAQGSRGYTEREALLKSVFDSQSNVREILSQCIVPHDGPAPRRQNNPLEHLLPDKRTEKEVPHVVDWPPLALPPAPKADQ
jgi:hypothetical protein